MEASYTIPDGNPAWGCADNSMNPETASGFYLEFWRAHYLDYFSGIFYLTVSRHLEHPTFALRAV